MRLAKLAAVLTIGLAVQGGLCGMTMAAAAETEAATELAAAETEAAGENVAMPAAEIAVLPVENLRPDFICGMDLSSYRAEKNSGGRYYDFEGEELDDAGFFTFLKEDCGVNCVRLRLWNDPRDENGNLYGGGVCDLETVCDIGALASAAGMQVMVDFHYSDFWADPGKQTAPKAWQGMTMDEKTEALGQFTKESLETLLACGVNVTLVQVGNETTNGLCGEDTWGRMAQLMQAGCAAVREVSAASGQEIRTVLHFTNPENKNYFSIARKLDENGVDYDIFASSYYPYWHGTLENLTQQLSLVAVNYGKDVLVSETSYIYTFADGDGSGNTESENKTGDVFAYEVSAQGQADSVRDVAAAVAAVGEPGLGVIYWESAWIPVGIAADEDGNVDEAQLEKNRALWATYGSGWASEAAADYDKDAGPYWGGSAVDNEAVFDFDGHPHASAAIFKYLYTGASAPLRAVTTSAADLTVDAGDAVALPAEVEVTYNDRSTERAAVVWDEEAVAAAAAGEPGEYVLRGTATASSGETLDVTMALTVNAVSLLENPGFEEPDMSAWVIDSATPGTVSRENDSNNTRSGDWCLHFWNSGEVEFSVEQTVVPDAGTYTFGLYLEGGDAGEDADLAIYARVGDETYETPTAVTGWRDWQNPEISGIVVEADGTEVTVGMRVKGAAGAWGAFDDVYLYAE